MEHTFRAMDEELAALSRDVAEMGEMAVSQIRAAVEAFLRRDAAAGAAVIEADSKLDAMDADIERRSIRFIALRQPMADDLRRPIAAMKIASQLERCGDLGKNLAKRMSRMEGSPEPAQAERIAELGRLVADRLAAVIAAYRAGSAEGALAVWSRDTDIDELHDAVFREILAGMGREPEAISVSTHLLFITKNLERIGDHATNIAELVHYEITGAELVDRPKL